MAEEKAVEPAQPATTGGKKTAPLDPGTEQVVTGRHILTGAPIVKEQPLKRRAIDPTYNTGDRRGYTVKTAITGSLNNRVFDLKVGETVNLNNDEYALFKNYVEDKK